MILSRHRRPFVPGLALLLLVACGPSAPDEPAASDPGDAVAPSAPAGAAASTRAALPGLFTIMAGLEEDMAGLERGLWRQDFDSIAARAAAIADHPTVPASEARAIAGVLGPEMAAFKRWDTGVHDLAVEIRDLARSGRLEEVLAARAELVRGCVGCHTQFRERIRMGVRSGPSEADSTG